MGYQALLFCSDEKLAAIVTQIFSELEFAIEAVHEPFAAVKKLMAQRYDALVIDSENEQNASLLFKSARNSGLNQGSLAIALVEGQAGVAKAYRIGANLVLTKPINVEQAKGTLRVARGLLRKTSESASASASAATSAAPPKIPAPTPAGSLVQHDRRRSPRVVPTIPVPSTALPTADVLPHGRRESPETEMPHFEAAPSISPSAMSSKAMSSGALPSRVMSSETMPSKFSETTASADSEEDPLEYPSDVAAPSTSKFTPAPAQKATPVLPSASTSVSSSAAAPAPAKTAREVTTPAKKAEIQASESATPVLVVAATASAPTFGSLNDGPAFAALGAEDSGGSGSSKKLLIAAAVLVVVAVAGYFGYTGLAKPNATPAPQPAPAAPNSQPSSPLPLSMSTPTSRPASVPTAVTTASASSSLSSSSQASGPKPQTIVLSSNPSNNPPNNQSSSTGNAPELRIAVAPEPAAKRTFSPLLVKSAATAATKAATSDDESAPQPPVVAANNTNSLNGLMPTEASRPSLATLKVSQGVSQGLLIKKVQPRYPAAALAVHAQGTVDIEATIDKQGNVTSPKVLHGDPILAAAAVEAVRQWRYKPYYLDGAPVEIQTQITVKFKAD
jgi:TonB family protein